MVTPSLMVMGESVARFQPGLRHMEDHRLLQDLVLQNHRVARLEETLAVIYKPAYGASGLSADMWAMERAELDNYRALHRAGHIGAPLYSLLVPYSLAKYARRRAVVAMRHLSG